MGPKVRHQITNEGEHLDTDKGRLVLTLRNNYGFTLGDDVTVQIIMIKGGSEVRIAIMGPKTKSIQRFKAEEPILLKGAV